MRCEELKIHVWLHAVERLHKGFDMGINSSQILFIRLATKCINFKSAE
jgi:hypothetical protein